MNKISPLSASFRSYRRTQSKYTRARTSYKQITTEGVRVVRVLMFCKTIMHGGNDSRFAWCKDSEELR